jgi:RNA polymerase sigma-70 factor (family 1)
LETEGDILYRLIKGDTKAFEVIFLKYNAKVYNFIKSILYEKAQVQDLTQNVFLSVWENRKSIDPTKNFPAYIFTIAQNLVYRQTEKLLLAHRYEEHLQKDLSRTHISIEEEIEYQSLERLILELIEKLPPSRKEIFLLSRMQGLSNKEIAHKLAISEKTVENQISRSIQFLKKCLKPYASLTIFFTFFFF